MLSETQLYAIANLCKFGILGTSELDFEFMDFLIDIKHKCIVNDTDDRITQVFKTFIRCGSVDDTTKHTHNDISHKELKETIIYKQSNDFYITIIAKTMYLLTGKTMKDFLKMQINEALTTCVLNIPDVYVTYLQSIGRTKEEIDNFIIKHKL